MDVLSDEEIAAREADTERIELAARGYYDEPEIPPECQRCGGSFGRIRKQWVSEDEWQWSGATTVGDRWVCNDGEQAEWEDHAFDLEAAVDRFYEDQFSALHDERDAF